MASGRVGGTRSKIRGQVGGTVYQVVRNPDGSYTQISYGKPEDVTQSITPRLQAQRMCTCMVEALMRDLRPVATISMQSAANKSKSLNAFSSFNLRLVAEDCKAHWNGGNRFHYPYTSNIGEANEQLGGMFLLSSGTFQYNGFDGVVHYSSAIDVWPEAYFLGKRFAGLQFNLYGSNETVESFLRRHYLTVLDSMVFACFHSWMDATIFPDDPVFTTRHSYVLLTINPNVPTDAIVTPDVLDELFLAQSDWEVFRRVSDDGRKYLVGVLVDNKNDDAYIYTMGGFTISYMDGKKKVSSSSFKQTDGSDDSYFIGAAPADVFGSWMGTPTVVPYPSPF